MKISITVDFDDIHIDKHETLTKEYIRNSTIGVGNLLKEVLSNMSDEVIKGILNLGPYSDGEEQK